MSLELVQQVSRDNPHLLPTNLGSTCYEHTAKLIALLLSLGHDAAFVCKSPGEGQYVPPGFHPRDVIGLDGKTYRCSGVSHDAIWCDGKQFDTIGSANEHDRFIYRANTPEGWSFNPADGPKITASPVWNEIPQQFWRANNPPLKDGAPSVPGPTQPPAPPAHKPYPGDAFFTDKIGAVLEADYAEAGQTLNAGSATWFARTIWRHVNEGMTIEQSTAQSRREWRAALGLPPLP